MDDPVTILFKVIGSVGGAVMALVFIYPKTSREFWTRLLFSIPAGIMFGGAAREWLKWPMTTEMILASSAVTAMLSWWVMGAFVRLADNWRQK